MKRSWNTVVIGGGISAASIARELALRKQQVVVFEKSDFCSGTSSCSSKLAHGGIRYLENYQFLSVFRALRERNLLFKNAAHLVHKIPLTLPIYPHGNPTWKIKLGLWLYRLFESPFAKSTHRFFSHADTLINIPEIRAEGLDSSAQFYDGQMDDARLCIETLIQAQKLGVDLFNYTEVLSVAFSSGPMRYEVTIKNHITQETQSICCNHIITAIGPWTTPFMDRIQIPLSHRDDVQLQLSKGSHIICPLFCKTPLILNAHQDGRVFFVLPWKSMNLIGTTEIPFEDTPDRATVSTAEQSYLLKELSYFFPHKTWNKTDILKQFAGVRPLIKSRNPLSQSSRDHQLTRVSDQIWVLSGGKYTTFRYIGESVLKTMWPHLSKSPFRRLSHSLKFPGHLNEPAQKYWQEHLEQQKLPPHLLIYGAQISEIVSIIEQNPSLKTKFSHSEVLKAELIYAIRHEFVKKPLDFIKRRSDLWLLEPQKLSATTNEVLEICTQYFSWNHLTLQTETEILHAAIANMHPSGIFN